MFQGDRGAELGKSSVGVQLALSKWLQVMKSHDPNPAPPLKSPCSNLLLGVRASKQKSKAQEGT